MTPYLTEVVVDDSPFVGRTLEEALVDVDLDLDVIRVIRTDETFPEPFERMRIRADDELVFRADFDALRGLMATAGLSLGSTANATAEELGIDQEQQTLVELDLPSRSRLVGQTLRSSAFRQRYDANVLPFAAAGNSFTSGWTASVRPHEIYDAVDWDVIFLLAGVIPLGIAFEETGPPP